LRISIDCKATVNIGDYSRGGKSRGKKPVKALDHDMGSKETLIPFGILNTMTHELDVFMGTSYKTSDFIVDCLENWWNRNQHLYPKVTELVINCDNGPESSSSRTQFLARIVEWSQRSHLNIHLVYYPPYHSKYNPIERCWAILELHWNGALLSNIGHAIAWADTMRWKKISPNVHLWDKIYSKGVTRTKAEMKSLEKYIQRNENLPKWDLEITSYLVN
jgi:hypothetical protein